MVVSCQSKLPKDLLRCIDGDEKILAIFRAVAMQDCRERLIQTVKNENIITTLSFCCTLSSCINKIKNALKREQIAVQDHQFTALLYELHESVENQALALYYRDNWQMILKKKMKGFGSLVEYAKAAFSPNDSLIFFEQWGSIGHPTHPNFKAKIGLLRQEVLSYSPEFQNRVAIKCCAIKKTLVSTAKGEAQYLETVERYFPALMAKWRMKIKCLALKSDHYLPVFIHPWQWENKVQTVFSSLLKNKQLLDLGIEQMTAPSMSFRTMISEQGPHLKLAMNVHTTSAMRTVSKGSVHNGCILSALLEKILKKVHFFNDTFFVCKDESGMHLSHKSFVQQEKSLALIIRTSPLNYCSKGDVVMPLACLFACSPKTNVPLLIELIEKSDLSYTVFFKNYCHLILKGHLYLYLCYGIALEAHQQNTLLIIRNNDVVKQINRDLGGIRVATDYLSKQVEEISLYKGSLIACDDFFEVRNKFIHANLQSNLAYCITVLSQYYHCSTNSLWRLVRAVIEEELLILKEKISTSLYVQEKEALLKKPWPYKSLLRMRLSCNAEYIYQYINNPLANL